MASMGKSYLSIRLMGWFQVSVSVTVETRSWKWQRCHFRMEGKYSRPNAGVEYGVIFTILKYIFFFNLAVRIWLLSVTKALVRAGAGCGLVLHHKLFLLDNAFLWSAQVNSCVSNGCTLNELTYQCDFYSNNTIVALKFYYIIIFIPPVFDTTSCPSH